MSGRRSKKNQKLGSSRRGTRGLGVNEDKDNDDGRNVNTENQSEATVSQSQSDHLPSLNIDRLTPVLESSPAELIHKDLEAEVGGPERKRKIGSTRKNTGGRKLKTCDEVKTTQEEFGEEQVTQRNTSAIEEERISFTEDEQSNLHEQSTIDLPSDVPMGQPVPRFGDVTAAKSGQETTLASNSGQKRKMGSTRKPRGGNKGGDDVEVQELLRNVTGDVWKAEVKSSSEAEFSMLTEMMQTWDDVKRRDSPTNTTNHTESAFVSSQSLSDERAEEPEAFAGIETTNLSVSFSVVDPVSETSSHHAESFINVSSDPNNHTGEFKVTASPPTRSDSFALNTDLEDFTDFNNSSKDLRQDSNTLQDCNSVKFGEAQEEPFRNISSSKQDDLDELVVHDEEPLSSSCTFGGASKSNNCEIFTDVAEDSKVSDTPTVTDSTAEMSNTPPDIYSLEDEGIIKSNILGQRIKMEEESTRLQMKHIEENLNTQATEDFVGERIEIQSEMQQGETNERNISDLLGNLSPVTGDLHNSNINLSSLLPEDGILSCDVMAQIVVSSNLTINSEESSASFPEVENVRESLEICVEMKEEKDINDVTETSVTFDVSMTEIVTDVEDFTEQGVDLQTSGTKTGPETNAFEMIGQDNVKDDNTEQIFMDAKYNVEEKRDIMSEMDVEDFTEQGVDLQTLAMGETESGTKIRPETDVFEMIDQDIVKDDVKDDNMDAEDNEGEEGGTTQVQVDPSQDDTERLENTMEVLEDVESLLPDEGSYDFIQGMSDKNANSEGPAFDKEVIEEFEDTGEHEKMEGSPVATLDVTEPLANVQDEKKDSNLEAFHVSESAENISESSLDSNTVPEQTEINIIPEDSHGDDIKQKMGLSVNKNAGLVVVLDSALMPSSCSSDILSDESTEERTCEETPIKFHLESQENAGHVESVPVEGDTEPRLEIQTTIMFDSTVVEEETEKTNFDFNILVRQVEFVGDEVTVESNMTARSDTTKMEASENVEDISALKDQDVVLAVSAETKTVSEKTEIFINPDDSQGDEEKDRDDGTVAEKATGLDSESQKQKNVIDHNIIQTIMYVRENEKHEITETVRSSVLCDDAVEKWHGDDTSKHEQTSLINISETQDGPPQTDSDNWMESEWEVVELRDGETEDTAVNDEATKSEEILTVEDMNSIVTVTSVTHQQSEDEEMSLSANTENDVFDLTNETSDERKEIEDFTESKVEEHLTNVNIQDNDNQPDLQTVLTEEENDTTPHMNLDELHEHAESVSTVTETDLSYGDVSGESLTVHENITEIPEDSRKEEIESELNPIAHKRKMGSTRRPLRGNKGQRNNRDQYKESETLNSESLIGEEKEKEREISMKKDNAPVEVLDFALVPSSCSSDLVSGESTEERICDVNQSQNPIKSHTELQENAGDVEGEPIDQDTEATVGATVTVESNFTIESDFLHNNPLDTKEEALKASEIVDSVSALSDAGRLLQDVDSEQMHTVSEKTEISINPEDSQGEDSQSKLSPVVHKRKMGSTRRPLRGIKEKIKSGKEIKEGASEEVSEEDTGLHLETRDENNVTDHNIMQTVMDVKDNEEHEITETVSRSTQEICGYAADKEKWHGEITSEQQQMSLANLSQTQDDPPQVDTVRLLESKREVGEEKDGETEDKAVHDEDTKSEEIFTLENMTSTVPATSVPHQQSEEEEMSLSANTENAAFDQTNETSDERKEIEDFIETKVEEHLTNVNFQDNDSQPDLQTVLIEEKNDTTPHMNLDELHEHAESVSTVTETDLSYGDVSGESLTVQENITEIPEDSQKEEIESELNPIAHKRKMGSTRRPLRGNKGQRKNRDQYDESETLNSESLIGGEKEKEREISMKKDAAPVEVLDFALMPSSCSSDLVSEESTEERICDIKQSQTPIKCHTELQENVEGEPKDKDTEATVGATVTVESNFTIESDFLHNNPLDTNEELLKASEILESVSALSDAGRLLQDVDSEQMHTVPGKTEISINPEDSQGEDSQSKLSPVVHKRKMGSTRRPLRGNKEKGQDVKKKEEKTNEDETEPHSEIQELKNVVDPIMQKMMDVGYNKEDEIPETVRVAEEEQSEHPFENKEWHGEITSEQEQKSSSDRSQTQDDPLQVDTERTMENEREAGEEKDGETKNTAVNDEDITSEEIFTVEEMTSTVPVTSVTHQQSEEEEMSLSANTENAAFDQTNETSDERKVIEDFIETKVEEHLTNVNIQDNDSQPDLQTVLIEEKNYTTPHMNLDELHEHAESVSTVTETDLSYGDVSGESLTVHENITEIPEDSQKEEMESVLNPIAHKRKMGSTRRPLRGNKGQRQNRDQYDESETLNSESLISEEKEKEREISMKKDAAPVEVLDFALMPSSCSSDLVSEESTEERICDIKQSQTPIKCHTELQENAGDVEGEPIDQDTEATVGATVTVESNFTIESDFLHNNPLDTNEEPLKASEILESVSALSDAGRLLQDVDSEQMHTVPEKTEISINPEDSQGEDSQLKLSPVVHKRKMGSTRRPLRGNKEKGQDVKEKEEKIIKEETEPHSEIQELNIFVGPIMQKILNVGYNKEEETSETAVDRTNKTNDQSIKIEDFKETGVEEHLTNVNAQDNDSQSDSQPENPEINILPAERDTNAHLEIQTEIKMFDSAIVGREGTEKSIGDVNVPMRQVEFVISDINQQALEASENIESVSAGLQKYVGSEETNTVCVKTEISINPEDSESKLSPVVHKRKMGSTRRPLRGKMEKEKDGEGMANEEDTKPHSEIQEDQNNVVDQTLMNVEHTVLTEEESDTSHHMNLEELQETEHAESISPLTTCGFSYEDVVTGESQTVQENITEIPEDSQKEEIQSKLNPLVQKRKMGSTRRPLRGNKEQRNNREQYDESETLNSESLIGEEKEKEREISVEKDAAPVEVLDFALMPSSCSSDLVSEESTEERICDITQSQTLHADTQDNTGNVESLPAERDTNAHLEFQTEIKMFDSAIVGREGTELKLCDVNVPMRQVEFVTSENVESVSAGLQKDVGSEETNTVSVKTEISINPEDTQREDSQSKLSPVVHKRKMGSTRRPLRGNKEKEKDGEEKANKEDTEPHSEIQDQNNVVDQTLMNVEHIVLTEEENDTSHHMNLEELQETEHAENISILTTCGFSYGDVVTGESQTVQENITEIPEDTQQEDSQSKLSPFIHKRKMGSTRRPLRGNKEKEKEDFQEKDGEEKANKEVTEPHSEIQDQNNLVDQTLMNFEHTVLTEEENDTTPHMNLEELQETEHAESISILTTCGFSYGDVVTGESQTVQENITEIPEDSQKEEIQSKLNPLVQKRKMGSTRRPLRGNKEKEKEDFQEKDGEEKANKEDTEPHSEIQDQYNVVNQKMKNVEQNEDKETSETIKMSGQEISEHSSENKEWHREITLEQEQKSSSDIFQTQTRPSQDDAYQNLPEIQEKRSDVLLMEENQIHILSQPVVVVESPQTEDGEIHSVSSSSMQKRRIGSTRKTLRGKKKENEREVGNENNVQTDDGTAKSEDNFTLEKATSLTITRTHVRHQQQGHDIQGNGSKSDKQTENPEENEGSEEQSDPNSYTSPEPLSVPECADRTQPTEPETLDMSRLDQSHEVIHCDVTKLSLSDKPSQSETVTTEKRRKMGSTRKNFRGKREVKREESEGTDPAGSHVPIQFAPRDDQNSDQIIRNSPEQSESSLLSEIERALNKTSQSSQNQLIINDPNSGDLVNSPVEALHLNTPENSKPEHGPDKDSLQVTKSQRPESPSELGSPGRRRKMGSTRKSPRQQLQVKREGEEMADDLEKDKQEPKVLKKDLEIAEESKVCDIEDHEGNKECLDVPIGLKTSCQLEESAKSGIQESTSPSTKRKFGSRRTNMAKRDVDELNPSECENELKSGEHKPDDLMIIKAGHHGRSPGQKQAIDLKNRTDQDMEMVQFNVVMVGNSCVGKTSFVRRFHKGHFTPDYSSTIGVDNCVQNVVLDDRVVKLHMGHNGVDTCVQNVVLDDRVVKLHIWDTAGQERFHSITTQVFHRANGLLLMYDITSSKSFVSVRNWITQVQEKAPDDVIMMLLGNKNDSPEREVQVQEGEDLAREYKINFMECSAATGHNVSECMKSLAELLVRRKRQKVEKHTALKTEQPQKKSGCC